MKKFFLALLLFVSPALIFASREDDLIKLEADLKQKIAISQDQIKTLSGQIAYYDNQIKLTLLKISQTEDQIASISAKINLLEDKLQEKSRLLEKQIRLSYKQGQLDPLQIFFSSDDVSQLISRFKYLQIVQSSNRRFLAETQFVQNNYGQQKTLVQDSQKRLQTQKTALANLRADRDNLLRQTKNNEALYQKQLEQAHLELEAIQKALANAVKQGPVNAGDPIGLVGNSGYPSCSTGKHLHFEVRVNDSWVNAETYLKNTTDKWGLNIGSGNWDWPIKGTIGVTQRYGKTNYSYVYKYSGGIHTGIDMVSNQDIIYAVADGTLYSYTGKCGSANLNIKFIDHGSGLKTLYLHVQ